MHYENINYCDHGMDDEERDIIDDNNNFNYNMEM